jgi:predicted ATPase
MYATQRYRALVTGSRTWEDEGRLYEALDELLVAHPDTLVVVHGACRTGADALAQQWAEHNGVQVERWPANWLMLGKRAGFVRNAAMVASGPQECLAFIRNGSPGATDCAGLAEADGIPTRRFLHDD